MVRGLPSVAQPREVCTGCLTSKQTRKYFPTKAEYSASQALQVIHGDLYGPTTPATPWGNKYFFFLVDDFNKVIWVYMLKSKDETFAAFK